MYISVLYEYIYFSMHVQVNYYKHLHCCSFNERNIIIDMFKDVFICELRWQKCVSFPANNDISKMSDSNLPATDICLILLKLKLVSNSVTFIQPQIKDLTPLPASAVETMCFCPTC